MYVNNISDKLRTLSFSTVIATSILAMTGVAGANPLNISNGGTLNFGNLSVQVQGTNTVGCINFYNTASPDACNLVGNNNFSVNAPVDPTLFVLGSTGTIKDIPAPTVFETAFITTAGVGALGTISFDLLNLVVPNYVACPPATTPGACDLPNSPFVFTVTDATHTTVSFSANLCGYTGASSGAGCSTGTLYSATFSSQFTGAQANLLTLINQSQTAAGITNSVSATLNPLSAIPEPMTGFLFGSGLLALGLAARKARSK